MLLRSVVHEVFNTYLFSSSIKKLFISDTMHDYNLIVCLFICVSLCVIIISVVCEYFIHYFACKMFIAMYTTTLIILILLFIPISDLIFRWQQKHRNGNGIV